MVKQPENPATKASRARSGHKQSGLTRLVYLVGILLLVFAVLPVEAANAETRKLKLYFLHTGEKAEITYKRNGKYIEGGLKKINHFLRDWRQNEPTKMDPKLLDLIWEVYEETGSNKHIHVISAYRSLKTNNLLRKRGRGVARKSQHSLGKALDFFIPGVKLAKLREIGLKKGIGGVGYYPKSGSPFVHMDTGRVRHWPRMTRKQLVRVFPNGKTLHVPTDGKPLPGYNIAKARYEKATSGKIVVAKAEEIEKKPGFFAKLLGRDDEDEENNDVAVATAPRAVETTTSAGLAAGLNSQTQAAQPAQEEFATISTRFVPIPVVAPREGLATGTQLAIDTAGSANQTEGEQQLASLVPVPVRAERSVVEAVTELVATDRQTQSEPVQVAALSPTEIQDLRRQVTAAIETPANPTTTVAAQTTQRIAQADAQRLFPPRVNLTSDRLRGTRPVRPSEGLTGAQESLFGYAPTSTPSTSTFVASNEITQTALTNQISGSDQPAEETASSTTGETGNAGSRFVAIPLASPARAETPAPQPAEIETASLDANDVDARPEIAAGEEALVSDISATDNIEVAGIPVPVPSPVRATLNVQIASLETSGENAPAAKPASSLERLVSAHLNKRAIGKWALATNARIADIADINPPAYGRNIIRERPNTVLSSGFTQDNIRDFTKGFSGSSIEFLSFKRFQ